MPCSKNKRIRKDQLPARPITTKDLEMAAQLAKDVFVQEDASQELVHSIAVLYTKIPEALERALEHVNSSKEELIALEAREKQLEANLAELEAETAQLKADRTKILNEMGFGAAEHENMAEKIEMIMLWEKMKMLCDEWEKMKMLCDECFAKLKRAVSDMATPPPGWAELEEAFSRPIAPPSVWMLAGQSADQPEPSERGSTDSGLSAATDPGLDADSRDEDDSPNA